MALRGKRLVWGSETEEGRRLNDGKVKWLVGGDTLVGRPPFGKRQINFKPTHTLFLLTNHKPHIASDNYALWQRVHLIPFTLSFVDEPIAKNERQTGSELSVKLKAEASGILAWLVRGCLEWQKMGLKPPEIVRQATKGTGRMKISWVILLMMPASRKEAEVQAGKLYKAYTEWCKRTGINPQTGRVR